MNYLHDGLLKIGFDKGEFFGIRTLPISEIESKIEKYISNLQEFNAKFDLVNTDDHDEIVIKHILDSLSAVPELCREISERFSKTTDDFVIADIGSGAGLPGIPLSIVLPSFNFLLVERMTKRCAFLENCRALLGLENVKIEENQAERIEQKRFDLCVSARKKDDESSPAHSERRWVPCSIQSPERKNNRRNAVASFGSKIQSPLAHSSFPD